MIAVIELQKHVVVGAMPGPHLLITGGVHGDEFRGPMAAIRRLKQAVRAESLAGQLTLVPVVNEAAFHLGNRVAEDHLDLARTCPGRAEGVADHGTNRGHLPSVSLFLLPTTTLICIPVELPCATLPLVGYMLHDDPGILEQQRLMARAFNLPIITVFNPTLNGRTISVARDAKMPAIYAEYLGGGYEPEGVKDYCDGCLNVMRKLKMIEHPEPATNVTLVVEDSTRFGSSADQSPRARIWFF